jgi:TolA-binding protein
MFKYISEILSKFTQRQRIIALSILLFSIIIISVGPKITESLTYNDEELKLRIESQNNQIVQLNNRIDELNNQVIENQRECTNEMVKRENEILTMISDIENYTNKMKNETRVVNSMSRKTYNINDDDSSVRVMAMIPESSNTTTIINNKRDEKLIGMIRNLKKKVKDQ